MSDSRSSCKIISTNNSLGWLRLLLGVLWLLFLFFFLFVLVLFAKKCHIFYFFFRLIRHACLICCNPSMTFAKRLGRSMEYEFIFPWGLLRCEVMKSSWITDLPFADNLVIHRNVWISVIYQIIS